MNSWAPRKYQVPALNFLYENKRANLWASPGTGKTSIVLSLFDLLKLLGEWTGPALVLGPKRVARDVWPNEARKWTNFQGLRVSAIVGTPEQRRRALQKPADVYTINYDNIQWLREQLGDQWPFRIVVADESTRIKSFRIMQGGKRAHALGEVAHRLTERWINLTGTPAPNGLQDVWGQQWFVDHGQRLGRTFSAFSQRWFRRNWSGYGIEPMPHADTEIKALLKDCTMTIDAKDWFDLREPVHSRVEVDLPEAAYATYKEMEDTLFTELLCGTKVEAFNAASVSSKCLQIASGGIYTKHPDWAPIHEAKIEALESVAEELNGQPFLLSYEWVFDKERILKRFKDAVDISTSAGFGKFMSGKARIGVAHPASIGHGVDGLQRITNILVRYSHGWNYENQAQMLERIGPTRQKQAGLDRPVLIYDIVARKTLEEAVLERISSKRSVEESLRNYMKRA